MQRIEHHNTEKLSVSYYISSYPLSRHYGDRSVPGNSLALLAMGQQSHLSLAPPVHHFTCPITSPVPSLNLSHHSTCPSPSLSITSPVHHLTCPSPHLSTPHLSITSPVPSLHLSITPPVHHLTCPIT